MRTERETLRAARERTILPSEELDSPTAEFRSIDDERWDIKDAISDHERNIDDRHRFIELACSVYQTNDCRAPVSHETDADSEPRKKAGRYAAFWLSLHVREPPLELP